MYNSGIALKNLVADIKNEADIAITIPNRTYVLWANALEQLLYTEIIKEQKKLTIQSPNSPIDIDTLTVGNDEAPIRFDDIHTVFADNRQLIKSTVTSGNIFPDTFYKTENNIGYNAENQPTQLDIIYYVKPALKTVDTNDEIGTGNVMLPLEFIDLMKAKLRAEAYKVANEDDFGAKWVNDYNVLLETFKAWVSTKQSEFGM